MTQIEIIRQVTKDFDYYASEYTQLSMIEFDSIEYLEQIERDLNETLKRIAKLKEYAE